MMRITEAIYADGVLKPVENLGLRDNQRVRLIVDTMEGVSVNRATALEQLKQGIQQTNLRLCGPLPSRDELHDRI